MATILEAKITLNDRVEHYSVSQLQYIYINSKDEWEEVKDHIECPYCGLKLMMTHRDKGSGNYLRRYPKTDHDKNCPYVEERVKNTGQVLVSAEDVGLSSADARNKAKYAIKRLLETPEQKAINDQKRKENRQKSKAKTTKVTNDPSISSNVNLKKEYNENDPKPRRSPQYRSAIGGYVTKEDVGKRKTFVGNITDLDFHDQNTAFPISLRITWGDRSGEVVMTQEMFNVEDNTRELLEILKNYIDKKEVLFSAIVDVIYNGDKIVGALSSSNFMWFGTRTTTLIDYLLQNKLIGYS